MLKHLPAFVWTAAIAVSSTGFAGAQQFDPVNLVNRVAAANAKTLSGVVANERTIDLDIAAGPMRRSEQNVATVLSQDGEPFYIHYTRVVQNGAAVTSAAITEREHQENADLRSGKGAFHRPYDLRYTSEYDYSSARCANCRDGYVAIAFHSKLRDENHGDGTMRVESAGARLEQMTYEPNKLPAHATAAAITETFAETLANVWTVVRIERAYSGRVGFFSGRAKVSETLTRYKRYATVAQALDAAQSSSPDASGAVNFARN